MLRGMENRRYPTDLSDEQWGLLETYLPASKWRGRPRLHSPREILNAVFYVLKSGCQWRMLPREFPPWKTVLHYFRAWRLDGTWERLNRVLRERLRVRLGRDPQPSAGIVDSHSAKTTGVGGQERGFDPAKKWTCVGSVDCFRLRTVRGKESSATNEPDLPTGVSPRSYPAG
jgi:putative transposase